ncbi:MAG: ROK family transcriptional regulator [Alphaproteobacteria bacterium]|nr:ROK family transcriptional regulator [Alphaproteobacteria bacterium]MBU1551619.1 ROK family transcriptional regulator [Alphaproteobacteria bacterium]MBU2337354.1 ROK family transcriptional regulator [Alphaproteobacteria bacterium]MBU2388097.1 ROK family transcriptional regulator [Alphaproteobacteria bacterium]
MADLYLAEALIPERFLRPEETVVVSSNERKLLQLIWRHPGISRSEITGHADLTQQSVHRILDQLSERGIVQLGEAKPGAGRGQPSPMLRLNGSHAYACGISVNTDIIGICILDLAGKILGESEVLLRELTMAQALNLVKQEVAELQRRNRLSPAQFFGVGFGIAGYHIDGTRHNAPLPLHEWSLIELGPIISSLFDRPAWVINAGKAGAVAESMFGAGRFIRHFAYLSFNYGFGGGVITDGELMHGGNGNAGEFSGMFDSEETKRRPALQYLIDRLNRNGVNVPSIHYMRRHFDCDWPGVAEWLDDVTPAYNRLVNALRAVVDPQAIVFGGQIPPDLAQMLAERTRIFDRPRYGIHRPHPKLIVSEIATDASAMGAAIIPFRRTFY